MSSTSKAAVMFSIEVITLPVSDVERALRFYVDRVGFTLDVDYSPNDAFRVVQLTPPGSGCSIQIGRGSTPPRDRSAISISSSPTLRPCTAICSNVESKSVKSGIRFPLMPGTGVLHPGSSRRTGDYASFAHFSDPDGNSWVLQERGYRNL